MASFPERVFSGVQPTDDGRIGCDLAALERFVAKQANSLRL